MRKGLIPFGAAFILFAGGAGAQVASTVLAENPLAIQRNDEVVAVPWNRIAAIQGIGPDRVRAVDGNGNEIASQVIDNDADGKPDELRSEEHTSELQSL